MKDDTLIKEKFFELFNSRIEFRISHVHKESVSTDYEIMNLWSTACKVNPEIIKGAFIELINNLRTEDAIDVDHKNYEQIKERRLQIRKSIKKKGGNDYANYLLELLEFIRRDKFSTNDIWTTTLYIDGLDELSPHAQNIVSSSLIPLLSKYSVRSLIMMRQSTYARRKASDTFSNNTDAIPHSGVKPLSAVIKKLERVKAANLVDHGISIQDEKSWHEHVDNTLNVLKGNSNNSIRETLLRLCGHSIRKAFKIAQYLLVAYEYSSEPHLKSILMKRIMIAQNSSRGYNWSEINAVENLFESHEENKFSPLLKMRMLYLLKNENFNYDGIQIADFCEHLGHYGYDSKSIRIALNELMDPHKRLLWCDSLLCFSSDESFLAARNSKVYLSSFSDGYFHLLSDFEYFSEMIWDTQVPDLIFSNWDNKPLKPNFVTNFVPYYLNFLLQIFKIDVFETEKCLSVLGQEAFAEFYNYPRLITQPIIGSYLKEVDKLISAKSLPPKDIAIITENYKNLEILVSIPTLSETLNRISVKKVGKHQLIIEYKSVS